MRKMDRRRQPVKAKAGGVVAWLARLATEHPVTVCALVVIATFLVATFMGGGTIIIAPGGRFEMRGR